MVEPPEVVAAHIAAAPLAGAHLAGWRAEVGEGVPGVGPRQHRPLVAPVVVAEAARRKVDIAALGAAGVGLVVAREALPQVALAAVPPVDVGHDRLDAVAEVLEHTAHIALEVEAHDHEAPRAALAAGQGRRVAPDRPAAHHMALVVAGVGEGEEPDLVELAAQHPGGQLELGQNGVVVGGVGLVEAPAAGPAAQVLVVAVTEAVDLNRVAVDLVPLDHLVAGQTPRAGPQVVDVLARQPVGVVPAEVLVEAPPAVGLEQRVVDDHGHAQLDGLERGVLGAHQGAGLVGALFAAKQPV